MSTAGITGSYSSVNNFIKSHPFLAMATHIHIYVLHSIAMEVTHLSSCCLTPYWHGALRKSRLELTTSSSFCQCPLPGSLAILNWLITEIPALRQCSVRRATAEKIILIWTLELIMCNTVSSFHHKFTTLQQVWIELKVFLTACLKTTHTQAPLVQSVTQNCPWQERLDHFSHLWDAEPAEQRNKES